MPKLYFNHIDVLIIEQIGKDITGAGMDPNIIGRTDLGVSANYNGPTITRIIILGLSEGSHHNATGMGNADFITRSLFNDIDFLSTYANCIASGGPISGKIPIVLEDENEAILAAIVTCPKIDVNNAKIVRIKDTLHLVSIEVSENLLPYCRTNQHFVIQE